MNSKQMALARKQLDRRLAPLRELKLVTPRKGWVRAIRDSLGMSNRQLAARMRVVTSRIPHLEKAEITGATTLRSLRHAATAMNCTLVYAFVPNEPLETIVHERAIKKARKAVSRLNHTMRLENQASLTPDLEAELRRTVDHIVSGSLRTLWDDEDDRRV
jgi:predicted DNA-binding mobile mystery protein A